MNRLVIPRRQRPRRLAFMLTPLIDVMFLLLIFFMLSSQLSPYSLLPIGRVAGERGASPAAPAETTAIADLSVRVAAGAVVVGGETIAIEAFPSAIETFRAQGFDGFLVIATRAASVQDIVSALEALQAAGVARVTLMNTAGGGT